MLFTALIFHMQHFLEYLICMYEFTCLCPFFKIYAIDLSLAHGGWTITYFVGNTRAWGIINVMSINIKLSPTDIALTKRLYDEYHDEYHMEDGWDKNHKLDNFEYMMRLPELTGVPISGATCLDVGCGTGDLSLFLRKRGMKDYVGVDVYGTSITRARQKYPDEKFVLGDFLNTPIRQKFDYAFCSGALTIKLTSMDNYDFLSSVVAKMWRLTRVGLVFNVLTDDDPFPDPDLFFYSIPQVIDICRNISKTAKIISEKTPDVAQVHVYMYREH